MVATTFKTIQIIDSQFCATNTPDFDGLTLLQIGVQSQQKCSAVCAWLSFTLIDCFTSHRKKKIFKRGPQHKPTPEWYHGYQVVRFPNPLAPDIQIHVSWGTRLIWSGWWFKTDIWGHRHILKTRNKKCQRYLERNCCRRGFLFLEQRKADSL